MRSFIQVETTDGRKFILNAAAIMSLEEHTDDSVFVRMLDGRGHRVKATFPEMAALLAVWRPLEAE